MSNSREDFEKFFRENDSNGDGELDLQEITDFIKTTGWDLVLADYIWFICDGKKTGTISVDTFMEKYDTFADYQADKTKVYRAMFQKLDRDGSKTLERKELFRFLHSFGGHWTKKRVTEILQQIDQDGSGDVDFDEFCLFLEELGKAVEKYLN